MKKEDTSMDIKRKLDELGRIVLPVYLRTSVGAESGDVFLVRKSGPRSIELELVPKKICVFCNSGEGLINSIHGFICNHCLIKLLLSICKEDEIKAVAKIINRLKNLDAKSNESFDDNAII